MMSENFDFDDIFRKALQVFLFVLLLALAIKFIGMMLGISQ